MAVNKNQLLSIAQNVMWLYIGTVLGHNTYKEVFQTVLSSSLKAELIELYTHYLFVFVA
jgi:hypothetical protein